MFRKLYFGLSLTIFVVGLVIVVPPLGFLVGVEWLSKKISKKSVADPVSKILKNLIDKLENQKGN